MDCDHGQIFHISSFPSIEPSLADKQACRHVFTSKTAWPFGALLLIRHGSTKANQLKQYCGRSDASLSTRGRQEAALVHRKLTKNDLLEPSAAVSFSNEPLVFASPLSRCLETANILWPHAKAQVIEGFAETDFGAWEGKTWQDLKDDPLYQRWLQEGYGSELAPPGGESSRQVIRRITQSWQDLLLQVFVLSVHRKQLACVVTHGGVIMNLITMLTQQPGQFYQWQCRPCEGFLITAESSLSAEVQP